MTEIPDELRQAHKHSSDHRQEVESSLICGCFFCLSVYPPSDIQEWVVKMKPDVGQRLFAPNAASIPFLETNQATR
ncbi:hypothetical protein MPL3365_30224 [Mesorhizobium plurifarium]|uniref:Uncharacterized protein n=1 Tax=Mesorhizobium plurifarium TaxID=69974 RepID=A0A090G7A0_MESPL|nr:hypothetical protein MPL3365_30224 [Mesorhizobium plurifarium]